MCFSFQKKKIDYWLLDFEANNLFISIFMWITSFKIPTYAFGLKESYLAQR